MITTGTSIFLLLLIAIFRYLKICKHAQRQMYLKWQKLSVIIIIVTVTIVSLPSFVVFGSAEVISEDGNLTGHRCTGVSGGQPKLALALGVSRLVSMIYPCKFGEIPHTGSRVILHTRSGTLTPMGSTLKPIMHLSTIFDLL